MNRVMICFALLVFSAVVLISCGSDESVELWNGTDFTGWEFVLADDSVSPEDVWSVQQGVIHCKGIPNGYMYTEAKYSDYELTLEWRWAEEPSNSGVLLHAQEPDEVWPVCIECQLKAGNAGDFVLIGPAAITVDGEEYDNTEQFLSIPKKRESSEKAPGEWNIYRILCDGGSITCYVNGVLQNEGTNASLQSGHICLQSEGAPIEFRNIVLTSLE